MKSWRFIFIDENESFTISTTQTTIIGYCVVRAPKGTTEATFFEAGNASAIQAMIGLGTSDWPDVKEAIAFNNGYGLWISAPPGSGDGYGSYYGGKYITTRGLKDFYKVEDKDEPNYSTLGDFTDKKFVKGTPAGDDGTGATPDSITLNILSTDSEIDGWDSVTEIVVDTGTSEEILLVKFPDEGRATEDSPGEITNDTSEPVKVGNWYYDGENNVVVVLNSAENIVSGLKEEYNYRFKYNVKNITKAYIVQKSCSEIETNITISDIGYDKYKYDQSLVYFKNSTGSAKDIDANVILSAGGLAIYVSEKTSETDDKTYIEGIFTVEEGKVVDVTSDYYTRTIYCRQNGNTQGGPDTNIKYCPLFYIDKNAEGDCIIEQMSPDHKNPDYHPKKDVTYNTISLSCTEQVIPGSQMNGGSWTGSLSETGLDQYGSNIYFPNIFPDDSLTFIEFKVVATFDDMVDEYGFYTGTRIVDPIGPAADVQEFAIKGQRYTNKLMRDNLKDGMTGGVYRPDHIFIIEAGLAELRAPKYDECSIAFECTGQPSIKPTLSSIRNSDDGHFFLTLIAPHPITQAEADNPATVTVGGRGRGVAYYVNEFQELCPYTGKKYWACPIGDVALMLAQIMDKKLGGCAPAWLNDNGLGGQLSRTVLKAKYDLTDNATKVFDEKGLNPIIFNSDVGLMITSQKTSELEAGDWSYLGHSMSFDLFKREMRDKVMRPQLLKAIDDHYMNIRQKEADNILSKRISGSRPIWAEGANYIKEVNTAQTKLQRKFVIKTKVKVNVFSEWVELVFTNVAQDGTIAFS